MNCVLWLFCSVNVSSCFTVPFWSYYVPYILTVGINLNFGIYNWLSFIGFLVYLQVLVVCSCLIWIAFCIWSILICYLSRFVQLFVWNSDFGFVAYYIVYIVYIVAVALLCPVSLDPFALLIWNFIQVWSFCISSSLLCLVSMTFVVFKLS